MSDRPIKFAPRLAEYLIRIIIIVGLGYILLLSCSNDSYDKAKNENNIICLSGGLWKADIESTDTSLREAATRWGMAKGRGNNEILEFLESREYTLWLEFAKHANFLINEESRGVYSVTMDLSDCPPMDDPGINEWIIHQNGQILVLYEFTYGTWGRTELHITLVGEIVSPSQFYADIYFLVDFDDARVITLKNMWFNRQGGKEVNSD